MSPLINPLAKGELSTALMLVFSLYLERIVCH